MDKGPFHKNEKITQRAPEKPSGARFLLFISRSPIKRSQLHIRICILPMVSGPPAILNRKFWTAVQAPKAHNALLFYPYRLFALYFYRMHWAFFCAQSAPDTGLFDTKFRCAAHLFVINRLRYQLRENRRCTRGHMSVHMTLSDTADHIVNIRFSSLGVLCRFFRGGKIKYRRPCVDHSNAVAGVYFSIFYGLASHIPGCARCCSISRNIIQVLRRPS